MPARRNPRALDLTRGEARAVHFAAGELAADPERMATWITSGSARAAFWRGMEKLATIADYPRAMRELARKKAHAAALAAALEALEKPAQ